MTTTPFRSLYVNPFDFLRMANQFYSLGIILQAHAGAWMSANGEALANEENQ